MAMARSYKRSELLINPPVQITMILLFIVPVVLILIFYFFSNLYTFNVFTDQVITAQNPNQALLELKSTVTTVWIICSFLTFLVIGPIVFLFSHRLSGPIYCLVKHLNAINRGETNADIRFRKGDYFSELETAFNQHMNNCRQQEAPPPTPKK
ncbi:MAG: hypothetical protein WCG27_01025 [Pseudomonadota bacterium]